ncbi:hypothetical protein LUZ61_011848 [Rhynchospora tenuis]|uniref:F-box domain-containing protein n=1 Tax=Rhynchospora tenuis TaxID=198213 RepID=A0AAD6A294_9POAL|nr:hypothetical protein LUZ61_011848 [Rhynchospora tenuis]
MCPKSEIPTDSDRISSLPLEIKISLLSLLDVKDAVRTSALAHSWRHLWTHLPRLRLNYRKERDQLGLGLGLTDAAFHTMWMERVVHLVSSLRGPIIDFRLSYYCSDHQSVSSLLNLLLQKGGLRKLWLCNYNHTSSVRPLISLSGFHALKVLKLSECHLVLPTGFCGFNHLTKLQLLGTQISSDDFNLLIRTSRNLTSSVRLELEAVQDPLSLNLSFPLLRFLQFIVTDSVERVSITSAPCLQEACILHGFHLTSTSEKLARVTLGLVTGVAMVSALTLGFDAFKYFSLVALPFNFTFPRLRFLTLYVFICSGDERMYDASVWVWLLRCMPFLEELELTLVGNDSSRANEVAILMRELAKKNYGFACLNRTLRSVTISMDELKVTASVTMAQYFLLNAKVLKELKIVYVIGSEVVPTVIGELQKVEIISSDAKVVIFDSKKKREITMLYMNN